ncbi:hypothetical protein BCR33DRAFT_848681 [Rhizoclosmatium globosum]|uniref:TLC domain-containing protein n=1 Tax=Rhizoclosmatium globosum TaxID=329046 RepID=A0A1Y2CJX5_9FUNG|nr:hypothetical protein BCR33DRAFT_848681 [Rhizoclosmatium globosum]|eukprot:ORY47312.1 hypothetical protein BCR33DRAFT_848681 [Rhizoclosmatium globosum]
MSSYQAPFDPTLMLAYIGVTFSPFLVMTQLAVISLLPLLSNFKKPRKTVFYILYLVPEVISFILLWIYYIVPVAANIASGNKVPSFDNPDVSMKVTLGVLYYYVMAYTLELLYNYQEMQFMLMLHHVSAISITLVASYLCLSLDNTNLLLIEYVILSGTSAVLHASIDFIPHMYLLLRQFDAPKRVIWFFGMLSIWPVTIFRLLANVFFALIVRYFVVNVMSTYSAIFYGWTVFMGTGTAILAVTQYWAHGIYVKIQKKDRKEEEYQSPMETLSDRW